MSKISVIIPCYNQAQYLGQALQSVLDQTYQDWECIIVNDGSPDNTAEVAKIWLENDTRFKYIYKSNGGLSSARNAGINIAQGTYMLFLDADDFIPQDKLLLSVNEFLKNQMLDIVITNYNYFYHETSEIKPAFLDLSTIKLNFNTIVNQWDIDFTIPIHCAMFTRSSIGEIRFNENLKAKEDWFFWIQFFKKDVKSTYISAALVTYRMHKKSMTKAASYMGESQDLVFSLLKSELTASEYELFLLKRIAYYKSNFLDNAQKFSLIKNSLTYRVGLKIRYFLAKMGLLSFTRTILNRIAK